MTPASALRVIPGLSDARVGIVLSDGPTNKSVLVENGDERFVLRVDKPCVGPLGLDRVAEEGICRLVAAAGISPDPVYYDHSNGIYLRRFVAGTIWLDCDLRNAGRLKRLAALLRQLHRLAAAGPEFDPGAAVQRYAQHLGTEQALCLQLRALDLLSVTRQRQDRVCLCHNDILNHNILESDKLMLIDWEFAAMGDPYFDLAVVVQHHGLGRKLGKQFLHAYLQRKPGDAELERLWLNCKFYACLLELWTLRIERL